MSTCQPWDRTRGQETHTRLLHAYYHWHVRSCMDKLWSRSIWMSVVLCQRTHVYSRTSPYGHLTKPVTPPFWSPWLSPKWIPMVKNRTLVPVIRSPPYSGIRSVVPSQVAESPQYNGQSRPSSDNWLHIHSDPSCRRRAGGRPLRPTIIKYMTTNGNQTLAVSVIQRSSHVDSN